MSLFGKLFGSNKPHTGQKVRAQFKDEKYFDRQIERCNLFISSDTEDFELYIKKHGALNSQHYITATEIRNKKIENYYSRGAAIPSLIPVYEESAGYYLKSWSTEYGNNVLMVEMLSFCLLLGLADRYFPDFNKFIDKWENNDLLPDELKPHPLVYFLLNRQAPQREGYEPLNILYEITRQPKQEAETQIKDYLEQWYTMHKDQPWYNTHTRENGYSGYWAWEVAVVVRKMQYSDALFKDNPFYPFDIVHWTS